jgi:molybdenum cofactor biosynthesis enzyme MoaA
MSKIIELFGKEIPIRSHYCSLFGKDPVEIDNPYVSLYVRTKGCNAKCPFCTYADDASRWNESKYIQVLEEIVSKIRIKKISFTGGEPTLNFKKFKRMVDIAKELSPDSELSVNTDGIRLKQLVEDEVSEKLNWICLSRHHYDDELNNKIFGFKAPSTEDLIKIQESSSNKDRLHFSCNLIKGYMDEKEKLYEFLEWVNNIGVKSVGFVSLMPNNDFSKKNLVDFKIRDLINERFNVTKQWQYKDLCRCSNYIYIPSDLKNLIKVYHKNTYRHLDIQESVIFDGQNVKLGFGEEVIY